MRHEFEVNSKLSTKYIKSIYSEINTIQGKVSLNSSSLRLEFVSV